MFRYPGLDLAQLVEGLSCGMRLKKPSLCPQPIANLISKCFTMEPDKRPNFEEIKVKSPKKWLPHAHHMRGARYLHIENILQYMGVGTG